jgi:hypothetical protein
MFLYLVKHSRPDLSNAVRELTKVMDGAATTHFKLMLSVVKYVISTKERGILLKPDLILNEITAYVDSDFAGHKGNRRSVTSFLIFLCGIPIFWKSKQHGGVTLSAVRQSITQSVKWQCS